MTARPMTSKPWFRWLLLGMLLLGIFFRFYNLDRKVFWHDEAHTPLHAAGHSEVELAALLESGTRLSPDELLHFQHRSPELGWPNTWESLLIHPEHPPLYYLLARVPMGWIDDPIVATRGFAAVISLLAFPALYWLARELFAEPLVAQVALVLFAVSPFQVLYAQEARQYSLLGVLILTSSAALLRAQRQQTITAWGAYAAATVAGLYTSLFYPFAIVAHGAYLAITEKFGRVSRRFLIVAAFCSATFLPWFALIYASREFLHDATAWTRLVAPRSVLLQHWSLHFSRNFLDFSLPLDRPVTILVPPLFLLAALGLLGWLTRRGQGQPALFLGLLIGANFAILALPDLVLGGIRSLNSRYFTQTSVVLPLLVAPAIATLLVQRRAVARRLGVSLLVVLLASGIGSCWASSQATGWWNKVVGAANADIAATVNATPEPLLLFDRSWTVLGDALSMSYLLNPDVQLAYVPETATLANYPECEFFVYYLNGDSIGQWQQEPNVEIELLQTGLSRLRRTGDGCNRPGEPVPEGDRQPQTFE